MESDPLPWLFLGIAVVSLIVSNSLDVAYAFVNRSEVRRKLEDSSPRARLIVELLHAHVHLFLALSVLKYLSLLCIGAASAYFVLTAAVQWQMGLIVIAGWSLLALIQPLWRAFVHKNATSFAFHLVPLMRGIMILLYPLAVIIEQISHWAGDNNVKSDDRTTISDEALRLLVSSSEKSSEEIEENEREMIVSILEMNETSARELMVPRIDMVTINVETSLHDALDTIINAGHSRIPVYEENIDSIVGLLYAKDLLKCFRDDQTDRPIRELLRPAYFVPASKKVDALFQEMQKQRVHIVVVVDEYGGTAGLVTIEDILEEIVGDIQDEYDLEEDAYVQGIGNDVYLLNSRLDVYSLTKLLDIEVDSENADTLGGLLYSLMEHVPEQGESVEYQGWRFTVLSLDGRRIEQVRAEPVAVDDETSRKALGTVAQAKRTADDSMANIQVAD
ncbi:MAG: HlyC/CorC family transporter [Caldilineaceae bacterium]|nr:HlyC/CorC family transporter [Caldilineaceae bacterium]